MEIDERQRHLLHEKLDDVIGPDEAATLMSHLPPVGWAEVATKHDLEQLRLAVGAEVRLEVGALRTEMHQELASLRADMNSEHGSIRDQVLSSHRQLVFAIIASQFTAVSLTFAATSL